MIYFFLRLLPFLILFIIVQTILRISFSIFEFNNVDWDLITITKTFIVGFIFDVASAVYFLIPFAIFILCIPKKAYRNLIDRYLTLVIFAVALFLLLFEMISAWFFWLEFESMYNFVAVDYLVYTHEVINNIRESYPVGWLLLGIFIIALVVSWLFRKKLILQTNSVNFLHRLYGFLGLIILCFVSYFTINFQYSEISLNRYNTELAQSPLFSLFHAYNANELDYKNFYLTGNDKNNINFLQQKLADKGVKFLNKNSIVREITSSAPEKKPNVILVLMESEGADYLNQNRSKSDPIITPNLSHLADEGLFFKNAYAIGTRTVLGIQGTTLSIPPLPGESIIRRENAEHLRGIGAIFKEHGYNNQFVYGGYSTFDNMKYYFENNDFSVVDRFDFSKNEITLATVWGVADENLFDKSIKEANKLSAEGKPFFQYILTTSNHRPFIYPEGRIDIPSKSGRIGAVKYADYAIGYFMKQAAKTKWYNNTIFIFIGDHQASSAGKTEVSRNKYPVVFIMYSPNKNLIKKKEVDTPISQIDLAPTLFSLLNFSYTSSFFGQNVFSNTYKPRYFISNYQKMGYIENNYMFILKPNKQLDVFDINTNKLITNAALYQTELQHAIAYFQTSAKWRTFMHKDQK
ncbi:LTA synthase family protein [Rickettsiales bacterium LUAb2]